jgi:hypothetical protein
MSRWRCPKCDREFGLARQSHVCAPGCTVEETFAGRPPYQREIYDALLSYLRSLGPVHADSVKVGVFLLSDRKFAEIRPMARALSVELFSPRPLVAERVMRSVPIGRGRTWNSIRLRAVEQVDDELLGWLGEAYDAATD